MKLLMVVFGQLGRGVGWTMLTNNEVLGDITAATGILFDLLLHLFFSANIIKYAATYVANWYKVSLTKLTELEQSVTAMGLFKMESFTCKYKVQGLCFQYMLVTIRKKPPELFKNIGLNLLVSL